MVDRKRVAFALFWQPVAVWALGTLAGLIGVVSLLASQQWLGAIFALVLTAYCGWRLPLAVRRSQELSARYRPGASVPTSDQDPPE